MFNNFNNEYEVCNCKKITLGEIIQIINEQKITKLGQLQDYINVGTECRNCLFQEADQGKVKKKIYCKDILNTIKKDQL